MAIRVRWASHTPPIVSSGARTQTSAGKLQFPPPSTPVSSNRSVGMAGLQISSAPPITGISGDGGRTTASLGSASGVKSPSSDTPPTDGEGTPGSHNGVTMPSRHMSSSLLRSRRSSIAATAPGSMERHKMSSSSSARSACSGGGGSLKQKYSRSHHPRRPYTLCYYPVGLRTSPREGTCKTVPSLRS